jgi:competence protein ComEC
MASSLLQTDVAAHRIFPARRVISLLEAWAEAERSRIGLWVPVVLGAGIAAWFALNTPEGWVGWIVGCCAAGLGWNAVSRRQQDQGGGCSGPGCGWRRAVRSSGRRRCSSASLRSNAPGVRRFCGAGWWRWSRNRRWAARACCWSRRHRGVAGLPGRVRLNVMDRDMPPRDGLGAGAVVAVRSRLLPPQPAAVPGGYDFAAQAYFMGIGATGRALPPVRVITPARAFGHGGDAGPPVPAYPRAIAWRRGRDRGDAGDRRHGRDRRGGCGCDAETAASRISSRSAGCMSRR